MHPSKYLTALSVAVVIGTLGVASASARDSDHRDDSGGIQIGPQGQVFGNPSTSGNEARAQAAPERKRVHARAAATAAYGFAAGSAVTIDPLAMQHKDKDWKHNYQSWCDVDASCNGWAEKMQEYEAGR